MQIGFIGLGAVVETAYLPALRRLGDVIDRCQGYDLDCSRRCRGSSAVVRCRRCWPNPGYALHYHLITSASARTGEGVSQRHFPHRGGKADRGQP